MSKEIAKVNNAVKVDDSNLDLTGLSEGIELKKSKLGKFEGRDIEGIKIDEMNIQVTGGIPSYTMWGDEKINKEDDGELLIECNNLEEAKREFEINNYVERGYKLKDIKGGYVLYFVNLKDGTPYILKMSPSGKTAFLNYVKAVKYKILGNENVTLGGIVTKLSIGTGSHGSNTWAVEKFEYVEDIK